MSRSLKLQVPADMWPVMSPNRALCRHWSCVEGATVTLLGNINLAIRPKLSNLHSRLCNNGWSLPRLLPLDEGLLGKSR